jgi:hypothetical protein
MPNHESVAHELKWDSLMIENMRFGIDDRQRLFSVLQMISTFHINYVFNLTYNILLHRIT